MDRSFRMRCERSLCSRWWTSSSTKIRPRSGTFRPLRTAFSQFLPAFSGCSRRSCVARLASVTKSRHVLHMQSDCTGILQLLYYTTQFYTTSGPSTIVCKSWLRIGNCEMERSSCNRGSQTFLKMNWAIVESVLRNSFPPKYESVWNGDCNQTNCD